MKTSFFDYDGFVEKFTPKKTTDDCYTPPLVYAAVRASTLPLFNPSTFQPTQKETA